MQHIAMKGFASSEAAFKATQSRCCIPNTRISLLTFHHYDALI